MGRIGIPGLVVNRVGVLWIIPTGLSIWIVGEHGDAADEL